MAQLFGERSSPLNFSRYPDWCAFCCAALFMVILRQCVDDLISIERNLVDRLRPRRMAYLRGFVWVGYSFQEIFHASRLFRALRAFVKLTPLPCSPATIQVYERRNEALLETHSAVMSRCRLSSGQAASLVGKLMFASVAFAGCVG